MNSWTLLGNTIAEYKKFICAMGLIIVCDFLMEANKLKQCA